MGLLAAAALTVGAVGVPALADPLKAIRQQGALHAFLVIRSEDGRIVGTGDEVNVRAGAVWRSRLTLHFKDGSIDDETTVYVQHATIKLLSDHHVQKGASFPKPMDMSVDMAKQTVTWHEMKDGRDEVKTEHVDLPADLSNGIVPLILQNIPKGAQELKMGYLVATPKPRVVKLAIHPDGQDRFTIGGQPRQANRFRAHVELGGIAGVVAPVIGKEPPDLHMWVVDDQVPTFLRLDTYLYENGPILSLELSSPTWSNSALR